MLKGKIKYVVFATLALVLTVSLVAFACAPKAAPEEGAKVEFEAQTWRPSTWLPAGVIWDDLNFIADYITTMSDGRIVVTPTAPGAICPVEEQVDNVAKGLAEAMDMWPGYYPGKVPLSGLEGGDMIPLKYMYQLVEFWEYFQGGKIAQMLRADYAKFGDVYWVGPHYWRCPNMINSRVPIPNADAVKGIKFRSSEGISRALAKMGAGTIWCPGSEIYTTLATGVVDAVTYSHAADALAMGFFEVTKYMITYPPMCDQTTDAFVVNGTLWNKLTPDLQKMVKSAVTAASWRGCNAADIEISKAIKTAVDEYGITLQAWPEESAEKYRAAMGEVLAEERGRSPECAQFVDLYFEYVKTIE